MNVYVSETCSGEDVFNVLGQVFNEEGDLYSNQFTFDLGSLRQIDALAVVSLNNLFAWLRNQGVRLTVIPPHVPELPANPLMTCFHEEGVYPHKESIRVQQGMIPLSHISSERSSSWVLTVFNRWLAEVLGVSTLSLYTPFQFLRLLFRYAVQHGTSSGAMVHSSLSNEELHIIFAHYGDGIPHLARNSWSEITNHAVDIAKATELYDPSDKIQKEISLYFLIEDVVLNTGGDVTIYSEFGSMKCMRTNFGLTQKLALSHAYFPGALFDIVFRLNATGLTSRINEPVSVSDYEEL